MQATHTHDHHHDHDHDHAHSHSQLQEGLRALILLLLGAYFAWNIVSGNLSNYINVRFAWLSYLAAGLFLLLGVFNLAILLRPYIGKSKRKHDDHAHDHDHDHNHGTISWGALAVVAIPLVLGTLIPSRPLGADAVDGSLSLSAASSTTTTAFTVNPLDRNVLDWLRVFSATSDYSEIEGEPADVVGFIYREPTFGDDQFMLARFTMSCCVADASAIGVPVAWTGANELQADSWVRVQGTFSVGEFRGDRVPVLRASAVETVEQPAHPYLYP